MNKGLEFLKKNYKLTLFLIAIIIFLTIFIVYAIPDETDRIHFLNVGSADAIIIESNGHYGIVDAANPSPNHASHGYTSNKDNGIKVINYLKDLGAKNLEFVIGTHSHSDHIGGIPDVADGVNSEGQSFVNSNTTYIYKTYTWISKEEGVGYKYDNQGFYNEAVNAMNKKNANMLETTSHSSSALSKLMNGAKFVDNTEDVTDYIEFTFYDYNIKVFNLYNVDTTGENVNSLVTLVTKDDKKVLLMADMDHVKSTEQKITKYIGNVDLLKIGHHGYNATSYGLMDNTSPTYAIFSNSKAIDIYKNAAIPIAYFRSIGTKLYRTGDYNSVIIATISSNITITADDKKAVSEITDQPEIGWHQGFDQTDSIVWAYISDEHKLTYKWNYLTSAGKKHWYYFDQRGIMQLGWLELSDGTYYLAETTPSDNSYDRGTMLTGWQKLTRNGHTNWYYFAKWKDSTHSNVDGYEEGQMITGWHYISDDYWDDGWYYFKSDNDNIQNFQKGAMVNNGWYVIEDEENPGTMVGYYLESSGIYKYKKDTNAPTVSVTGNTTTPSKTITLKIQTAYDCSNEGVDCIGLDEEPYSFDGGLHWQSSNQKTFTENGPVNIWVRDKAGNTKKIVENITSIVNEGPIITDVTGNRDNWDKSNVTLVINAKSNGAALHNTAYSFDDGLHWQSDNKKTYTENTSDIKIKVRDIFGNATSYSQTINITKIKRVTGIIIKDEISKKEYIKNSESLNLDNGTISVKYNDGSSETVSITENMVSGFSNGTLGRKKITVSYTEPETSKKFTASFYVTIIAKEVDSIAMGNLPTKKSYVKDSNEELDLSGGSIIVTYNDDSRETITLPNADVTHSGFDKSEVGKNRITLTYENHSTTFEVDIIEKTVTEIKVTTLPTKKTYIQNYENELILTGGKLRVTYNDGTTSIIDLDSEDVSTSDFNNTKIGTNTITVTYKNVSTTFDVEIIGKSIVNIKLTHDLNKMDYIESYEDLDLTGGELTVTYDDESKQVIHLPNEAVKYSGFNNKTVGDSTITLTYEGHTTTFNVHIIAKSIVSIAMDSLPIKTTYIKNSSETLDLKGARLRINYNNNTYGVIDLPNNLVTTSALDNKTTGEKTITVTYKNNQTSFKINVIEETLKVISIKVITLPTKKNYIQNFENELKLDGGVLQVTYENNITRNISLTSEDIKTEGFNNTKIGLNTIKVIYEGKETTFDIQIVSKSITGISLTTNPQKMEYIQNYENLDLTGGILTVNYNDNSHDTINLPNADVTHSGFSNKSLGANRITLSYKGFTVSFNVQIISKSVTGISIAQEPLKKVYIQSSKEELDLYGGIIKVNYNDNTSSNISMQNSKITTSGFTTASLGEKTIKVSYEGFEATFKVTVVAKEVIKIEITKLPNKLKYIQKLEELDLDGGEVLITFVDGSTNKMSLTNKAITKTGFDNNELGKKTIVISYEGVKTSFEIEIIDKRATKIEVTKMPLKTMYIENYEELDLEGGVLTVTYHDGTTDNISLTNSKVKVTGFNNKVVGKNTLTVTYEDLTTNFTMEIIPKSIVKIEISHAITKVDYLLNVEQFNASGGILKVYYNDDTYEEIDMTDSRIEYIGFDNTILGEQTITLKYAGFETKFDIKVYHDEKGDRGDNPKTGFNMERGIILITSLLLIGFGSYMYLKKYKKLFKI